jgi:glycosyltransferase involved in cell wall biosynthesis
VILFGHQTGNPNSHHAALAHFERGRLEAFVVPWFPGSASLDLLKQFPPTRAMAMRLSRRRFEPLAGARFVQGKTGEFKRLFLRASGSGDEGLCYEVNDWLMDKMCRELARPGVTAIHSPEDASLRQFDEAKRRGISCIYDLPIGYYPWWEEKQKVLAKEYADWVPAGGLPANRYVRPAQKVKEMELADLVLVACSFVEKTIREFRPEKKIALASYGVDAEFWSPVGGGEHEVQRPEAEGQRTDGGAERSETDWSEATAAQRDRRGARSNRRPDVGRQRAEDGERMSEVGERRSEGPEGDLLPPSSLPKGHLAEPRFSRPVTHPLRFIYAGQSSIRKGIPVLMEAWKRAQLRDAELLLVGSWQLADSKLKQLPSRVSYLGPVGPEKLRELYRESDVFVFPSFFEGFGLVILEAMACGLPVIASDRSAGPDVLGDLYGRVVTAGDIDQLAETLRWFAENREKIPAMKSAARRKAESFTWEKYREAVSDAVAPYVG